MKPWVWGFLFLVAGSFLGAEDTPVYSTVKYELRAYGHPGATETVALVLPGEKLTFHFIEAATVTLKKDWIAQVSNAAGIKGYIPVAYLSLKAPQMKALGGLKKAVYIPQKRFVAAVAFPLKDQPKISGKDVGTVVKDDRVTVLKYSDTTEFIKGYVSKWVQVRTETGLEGWIFGGLLSEKPDLGDGVAWTEADFSPAQARIIPKSLRKVDYGEGQRITKKYEVFQPKGPQWKSYKGGTASVYVLEVPKAYVYTYPGNNPIGVLKQGFQGAVDSIQEFKLEGVPLSWGYLRSSQGDGWVQMKDFRKSNQTVTVDPAPVKKSAGEAGVAELQKKVYFVTAASAAVYNFPGDSVVGDLKKGTQVQVTHQEKFSFDTATEGTSWSFVDTPNLAGWVESSLLGEAEDLVAQQPQGVTAIQVNPQVKQRILDFFKAKIAFYKTKPAKEKLGDKAWFTDQLNQLAVKYQFRDNKDAGIKARQMVGDQDILNILTANAEASQILQTTYQIIGAYQEKIELFKSERAKKLWYKESEFIEVLNEIAVKWGFSSNDEQRYMYQNEMAYDEDLEYWMKANNDAYQALSDWIDRNPREAITSSGSIAYPVKDPFMISSNFGPRYVGGRWDNHTGIDFIGRGSNINGREIQSMDNGRVIFAGVSGGYGNLVIVQHANLVTYYAHQSRIAVKEGDELKKGQVLGYVGSTGWSTGPHLHFEIRDKLWGKVFDPRAFFTDLPKEMQ